MPTTSAEDYGDFATPEFNIGDYDTFINSISNPSNSGASGYDATSEVYANAAAADVPNIFANHRTAEDQSMDALKDYKPEKTFTDHIKQIWESVNDPNNAKNPLLMMGLMGLSNAQNNANKRELADKQAQSDMALVNQKYANERKTAEDNSAAILAIPKKQGIIQTALKRIDGTPVFNTNGTVKA